MGSIKINDEIIEFEAGDSILKLASENGFDIPTLCFLEDCGNVGQCGICLVEIEGQEKLARSCIIKAKDGMVVRTDTKRVADEVKQTISGILDKHEFKCGACKRRENCEFLKLVIKTKARASKPFKAENRETYVDDRSDAICLDRTKCTVCGRCVAACRTKTGVRAVKFERVDGERRIVTQEGKVFDDTNCLLCGQCVSACPVDAIKEKSHIERVQEALEDSTKHVIVAIAPAVRTSMGELFGMGFGVDTTGKIYFALRELGFDKVFDINFGADMTIMEEATELIHRLKDNDNLPMFTSCCPAWVRLVEKLYPDLKKNLSTTKSPQQIFGVATKTYYPEMVGIPAKDVFTVTVMPCVAKKAEADNDDFEFMGNREIDAVITTRELAAMIKAKKINFKNLEDGNSDSIMGLYSGAGAIFGSTGGVMEASLRSASDFISKTSLEKVDYEEVRGFDGVKEAMIKLGDYDLKVAVINGAANIKNFIDSDKINDGYHFIECMACSGGCINGGGQPHLNAKQRQEIDIKTLRSKVLYNQDVNVLEKRKAHENPSIIKLYDEYMGEVGGQKAHKLLHYCHDKENKH